MLQRIAFGFLLLSLLTLGGACKKSGTSEGLPTPEAEAAAKEKVRDDLPQAADITKDAPRVAWGQPRQSVTEALTKQGLTVERFKKKFVAWNGKFEGYEGRMLLEFQRGEGPSGPVREITLLAWQENAKAGSTPQQRQAILDFWSNKLAARYGADFKKEQTERTQSHVWQKDGVEIELRTVTANDAQPQIAIYWTRGGGGEEEEEEEMERERERKRKGGGIFSDDAEEEERGREERQKRAAPTPAP